MPHFMRLLGRRRQEEIQGESLLSLCSELLGVVTPDGRLLPENDAWEAALGRPRSELRGLHFLTLFHPEDQLALHAAWDEVRRSPATSKDVAARGRRADGGWALFAWTVASGVEGSVLLAGRACLECTTQRKALAALIPSALLGRLALGLTHDVNRILHLIGICVEALRPRVAGDVEACRDLDSAEEATRLAAELAREFVHAARGAAPGSAELNETVLRAQHLLGRLMPSSRFRTDLDPEAGRVALSSGALVQILLNLTINARDAMPDGSSVLVSTQRSPTGAVLAVADTGTGLTPEQQRHLFEPFFTTKAPGHGSGVGLVLVRDLAASCGGDVSVSSRPGCGTTVLVHLPAALAY